MAVAVAVADGGGPLATRVKSMMWTLGPFDRGSYAGNVSGSAAVAVPVAVAEEVAGGALFSPAFRDRSGW